jgi:predicted alpha/beta superfamily hydrolase
MHVAMPRGSKANLILLILTFLSLSAAGTQSAENPPSADQELPAVTLPWTEALTYYSKIVDQDFTLSISLPTGYAQTDTTYPSLYVLDANIGFGIVSNLVRILATLHKEIPELVVVGIGYPIDGLADWVILRNRDLSPTSDPESDEYWMARLSQATGRDDIIIVSGGAPRFLESIREELIPFVESRYRVSPTDRALMGHSRGGLFAHYVLFHHPDTFNRYLISSASNRWDGNILFRFEQAYFDSHGDLDAKVFMSYGSMEDDVGIANMYKMKALLLSRAYPNLKLETHLFEDENHGSVSPGAFSRGLRTIYK